ncbi:MAG: phosphoglucosamine mutase [bacterium]|nr:phosphoglucosamine mutase [bacterium]
MKLFGTDGIRALVNEEIMSPEMGVKMGIALVLYCQKRNAPLKIVIGRDTRESGVMLEEAIICGIISMGGTAVLAGIIPTPGVAYSVGEEKAGAGIVISASHNSFEYNGLKPFNDDGTKLTDEEESELQKYILERSAKKTGTNFVLGQKIILTDAKEKYANFLLSKVSNLELGNLKIVLDCANGATYEIASKVFGKKAEVTEVLFASPNGKNINSNCGSQHIETLRKKVIEKKADLGLAFDGDGDRLIVIDEKGNALNGDQIIYLIAKMMQKKGELKNEAVVTTVMSNIGFISSLKKIGIKHFVAGVGDRQVSQEMKKREIILGGEESGHIIMSNFQPTGDGIASGLMLISAINYFNEKLSKLTQEIVLFPKILVNVLVKNKPELETVPEIMEIIRKIENILGENGRVLVRYSGTENLCRVMIEGRNKEEIKNYADQIVRVINNLLN